MSTGSYWAADLKDYNLLLSNLEKKKTRVETMAKITRAGSASPPDGGWGWMIVAGCFLVTICTRAVTRAVMSLIRSYGAKRTTVSKSVLRQASTLPLLLVTGDRRYFTQFLYKQLHTSDYMCMLFEISEMMYFHFFVEFQTYFAQDYSQTAWIHSIADCMTMLCAPLGSVVSNHLSCQVGIMLGGLLASTGFILGSFATSLKHLYLTLGVLTGLGFALCYSPAVAMVGKYFSRRKALAYGIAMSGSGIGTFILAPVVQLLIEQFSWRGALLILGGFVLNLCVCGALMRPITLKEDPSSPEKKHDCGTQKEDYSPLTKEWAQTCVCCSLQQEYSFLLISDFVALAVSVLFMAYGCSPLFVYLVPYALSVGVSHQQAAFLMSILGVIDIIGNITFGWLTDRRCLKNYRYACYLFAVGLDGLCYLCLPMLQSLPLLVPFSCTFGYFDGAYVTLIPVVTAEIVGTTSLSSALGVVYFLHAVPYLVSPPIAGWLVDTTGSYTAAFLLCGFSMIFSSVLLGFARIVKRMKRTQLRFLAKESDPKLQLWNNGSAAYSVARQLDQKEEEAIATAVSGCNLT